MRFAGKVGFGFVLGVWLGVTLGCGGAASPPPAPEPPAVQLQPQPSEPAAAAQPYSDQIRVDAPAPGAVVGSPLMITGEARGPWFFEATFPVQLRDSGGRLLAESYAQARGEWMTESFVPFFVELRFDPPPSGDEGSLVLEKANPSDLPEHGGALRIPVRFGAAKAAAP
jgi:hypothetical protein